MEYRNTTFSFPAYFMLYLGSLESAIGKSANLFNSPVVEAEKDFLLFPERLFYSYMYNIIHSSQFFLLATGRSKSAKRKVFSLA